MLALSRSPQHQRLIRVALRLDKLEVDENSPVSTPHLCSYVISGTCGGCYTVLYRLDKSKWLCARSRTPNDCAVLHTL